MSKEQVKLLAVDGDILAYRTAAVCEEDFEGACKSILDSTLAQISTDTGIPHMRIYLSGEDNFRYKIGKTKPYKGNRATMVRPRFLGFCKQYLVENYSAIEVHGYEADDGIATDMTFYGSAHCGIDKDLLQVPGMHYNYVNKEWQEITPEEAEIRLWRQVLMGDNSDNVPGIPGCGVKTAEKIIYSHETAEIDAFDYYAQMVPVKYPGMNSVEYMAEQLNLIRMVRNVELNFTRKCYIEGRTEGFEAQDGDFRSAEDTAKTAPKL